LFQGQELLLHEDFRLFLQTTLANPHYPPDIHAETAVIDFSVTEQGLGDQLLALVIRREWPNLANTRLELIAAQNKAMIQLKELEDDLLLKLGSPKGDILTDTELIEQLEFSKNLALEIE